LIFSFNLFQWTVPVAESTSFVVFLIKDSCA